MDVCMYVWTYVCMYVCRLCLSHVIVPAIYLHRPQFYFSKVCCLKSLVVILLEKCERGPSERQRCTWEYYIKMKSFVYSVTKNMAGVRNLRARY